MPRPAAPALEVSPAQREELVRMSRSTSRPHRVVVQARAMLLAADGLADAGRAPRAGAWLRPADGLANAETPRRCEVDPDAVRRWRARFAVEGPTGLGVI